MGRVALATAPITTIDGAGLLPMSDTSGGELPRNLSPRGSMWNRWEPHVHTPGTVLNDQFTGADAWERYLKKIEDATPRIRALGITDYYSTETYERVLRATTDNRLRDCALIFPNVEMRLAVGTVKGRWANIHLLVSPEDPSHLCELWRFLGRLTFAAYEDSFTCTKEDLIKLGRKSDTSLSDTAARENGATQFKVTFSDLVSIYNASAWAKANILVAVAGSETDGTSGIRDAADATLRQEIERFAHILFSSSPSQRDFWLGRRSASVEVLRDRYRGPKPCLHGSDGHDHEAAASPDGDRYSWIKGAVAFDTLRQAIIDPAGRAFVGINPPLRAAPSQVISSVTLKNADWLQTRSIELNPGLIAIIGARGSGKTALADAIAAGCDATLGRLSEASFLRRAKDLLGGVSVRLDWENGKPSQRLLIDDSETDTYPRARYLSQKFVETLCSATGLNDELLQEIERVIFEAHPTDTRDGALDFDELLATRALRFRQAREREEDAIATLSSRIGLEREKETLIGGLRADKKRKEDLIKGYVKDRDQLVSKGSEQRVARLAALNSAAEKVRGHVRSYTNREQALLSLKDDIAAFRQHRAPEQLRETKQSFRVTGMTDEQWNLFLLRHSGDVDAGVDEQLKACRNTANAWRGKTPTPAGKDESLIAVDAELDRLPLATLEAEAERVQKLINVDTDTAKKYGVLARRVVEETAALDRLTVTLTDCEGARSRAKELYQERDGAYRRVFDAIYAEETLLKELYAPLMQRLRIATGTLRKLSFSVSRHVDVKRWAAQGENLFDLRRQGPFKGKGSKHPSIYRS